MARINEIKDQQAVVTTVGGFAGTLQQIATIRMVKLRKTVLASRRFVDEATLVLRELHQERSKQVQKDLGLNSGLTTKALIPSKTAVIVVTSNQGLCGSYNTEIFYRLEKCLKALPQADYFVLGHKGQNYFENMQKKIKVKYFPYEVSEVVTLSELKPVIGMFYFYDLIYLMYSQYINTTTRKVVFVELAVPNIEAVTTIKEKEEGKYIFEPSIDELIAQVTGRIRYALFRQQLLDSKLSLYTAQMVAMKTASDNAQNLLADLSLEYNKARRKLVDKKINEVQAGRTLWADSV
jgi:F-type H+-transporting ATPase subunit gamma